MKTLALIPILALAALAGCANAPLKIIPPAQLVHDFCPVVNADLKALAASPLLTPAQKEVLDGTPGDPNKPGIIAINNAVCAAGGQIDASDIQKLNDTAFPALISLVGALPMLPNQPAILLGLTLAQPILNQIAAQVLPAAPAPAPAAAAVQ